MYTIENLSYKYKKNKDFTLNNINLKMNEGEVTGLLGPSGAGKSTFQNILIKLLSDYQGNIYYNDRNLQEINKDYYNKIGVCFELPVMVASLSCIENIKFLSKFYKSVADYEFLLKEVGLWEDRNKLVGNFSKGMKMRLNFVRALLNNPTVLFLDEPTNGLDPISASKVKQMIKNYAQAGNTVIITTHLMNDVEEICDKVAFIKDGTIVETGTPDELKEKYSKKTLETCTDQFTKNFDFDTFASNNEFQEIIKRDDLISINTKTKTMNDIFKIIIGGSDE